MIDTKKMSALFGFDNTVNGFDDEVGFDQDYENPLMLLPIEVNAILEAEDIDEKLFDETVLTSKKEQ